MVRAAARWVRREGVKAVGLGFDTAVRHALPLHHDAREALCRFDPASGWARGPAANPAQAALLDLYLPVCATGPGRRVAIGHLGQSLDGHIATQSGDSYYVTGPANLRHLHRMRALCDAVVVGAETVLHDDPRLTTRLVPGDHPVRVVLDPSRRLDDRYRVFQNDEGTTLLVCEEALCGPAAERHGRAEIIGVPVAQGRLRLDVLLERLAGRGLDAVFVEGGGATVSGFLEAGLLDRIQVAIAALITGQGRPGLRLPAGDRLGDCLRPPHRVFRMGQDLLFDCDLRASAASDHSEAAADDELIRIL